MHEQAVVFRRTNGVDVFLGEARFVAPKVLRVGNDVLRGERFVLATGSRPRIPPIAGLADSPYLTSDNVMRLNTLPQSMVVLGSGYVAAETSHIFGSLGTEVTIVGRAAHVLSRHDVDAHPAAGTGHVPGEHDRPDRPRRPVPPRRGGPIYIHPALTEVVEQALLEL